MKLTAQKLLVCPRCQSSLALETLEAEADEVIDGRLRCACGIVYPIIQGVPRMLPPDLIPSLEDDYAEFFERHGHLRPELPPPQRATTAIQRRTQEAFGYEWTAWADYDADTFAHWLPAGFDAAQGFRGKL